MSTARLLAYVAIAAACALALGYGGTRSYFWYRSFVGEIERDRARAAEVEANRARIGSALEKVGISPLQASRGFWYTYTDRYGNQSVFYFDPDTWGLQENLTDEQLQELVRRLSSSVVVDRESMREVPAAELPPELQFHNALYTDRAPGDYQRIQGILESKYERGEASSEELWQLSYLYELEGKYEARDRVNAENCSRFGKRCAERMTIRVIGVVVDKSGRPVQGARVRVLSDPSHPGTTTDLFGAYSLEISVHPMQKVRLSAIKRNFSDGVASVLVLGGDKNSYVADPIVLGSPITIITLDTVKKTITDKKSEAREDGSFVVRGESSTYVIPKDAIVRSDGTPYRGVVDVYLYEFTRQTVPESLVTLDTFDQAMGYAGDMMQTYGMPYIQFFAQTGEELHVQKSNPMVLTYKMTGFKTLRENTDGLPQGGLSDRDIQVLLFASHGGGYPITREFLIEKQLFTFPPFWAMDRKKGVWENVGVKLLDEEGTIETLFYTIN